VKETSSPNAVVIEMYTAASCFCKYLSFIIVNVKLVGVQWLQIKKTIPLMPNVLLNLMVKQVLGIYHFLSVWTIMELIGNLKNKSMRILKIIIINYRS